VNVQDVNWLQSITSLPILVKGVVTAEDGELLRSLLLLPLHTNQTLLS
jgi:isopentenyl diphosphate isomerase/L-lactate dehydrogenase-like FMN-dependent dehydrogenase